MSLGSDLWVLMSVTERGFADLTDVTLADEDINSIPTDGVYGNPRQCGIASGATWWPKLKLMQVVTLGGQTCN